MNTPAWAGACQHCMPDDLPAWSDFVFRVIRDTHTAFPDVEVVYGIWNEPNLTGPRGFFEGTELDYSLLFQYASAARDQANREARLAAPELSVGGLGPLLFMQAVMKRIAPYFRARDVVTFHWYPGQGSLSEWVTAITAAGNGHEVWLTETGNHTCSDIDQRATLDYLINVFDFQNPTPLWTKVFIYYLWDPTTICSANILRADGSSRPAYLDYRNRATGVSNPQHGLSLRAANGKFVAAENGGGSTLAANRRSAGTWETFDLLDLNTGTLRDGDRVALQAADGLYVQADQGGGGALIAAGLAPGPWETFTVVALRSSRDGVLTGGDTIALRSDNGYYVSADIAATEMLTADRTSIGQWETFELAP
jgi:hypothetical protein